MKTTLKVNTDDLTKYPDGILSTHDIADIYHCSIDRAQKAVRMTGYKPKKRGIRKYVDDGSEWAGVEVSVTVSRHDGPPVAVKHIIKNCNMPKNEAICRGVAAAEHALVSVLSEGRAPSACCVCGGGFFNTSMVDGKVAVTCGACGS